MVLFHGYVEEQAGAFSNLKTIFGKRPFLA